MVSQVLTVHKENVDNLEDKVKEVLLDYLGMQAPLEKEAHQGKQGKQDLLEKLEPLDLLDHLV